SIGAVFAGILAIVVLDNSIDFVLHSTGFDPADPQSDGDGGFGLTSMQERMRLVGGRLDVESAPGWGTRVRGQVSLDEQRRPDSPGGVHPVDAEPIRVLLVDDHPLAREGI